MKPHGADRRWTARGRPRGSRDCASGFARSFTTHRSKPRDSNPEARTCITPRRTTRRTGSARAHPEHWTPCSGGKQPQPPRRARRARWANRADLRIRRPVTTTRVKEGPPGHASPPPVPSLDGCVHGVSKESPESARDPASSRASPGGTEGADSGGGGSGGGETSPPGHEQGKKQLGEDIDETMEGFVAASPAQRRRRRSYSDPIQRTPPSPRSGGTEQTRVSRTKTGGPIRPTPSGGNARW